MCIRDRVGKDKRKGVSFVTTVILTIGAHDILLQCFDTVSWVICPVKTRPRYDLMHLVRRKPYSTNQPTILLRIELQETTIVLQ